MPKPRFFIQIRKKSEVYIFTSRKFTREKTKSAMNAPQKKFSISSRLKSFSYAFNGLKVFFIGEHNAWIHAVAAFLALLLAFIIGLSAGEWLAILGVIALVFITEIINTAVEKLADALSTDFNPQLKKVKDLAAGAVLVSAIFALIVGLIIFIPKLFYSN